MPAGKGGYAVTITAIDNASKQIDAINKKLDSISAPVRRLQGSFGKLADSTGLRAFGTGLKDIGHDAERLLQTVGRLAAPFAALTGAAGIAGIAELSKSFGDFGSNLYLTAKRAGMSAPQLQALGNAARLAGGSAEAATSSAVDLQRNLALGQAGLAPPSFRAAMSGIGINNWQGQSAAKVMPEILKRLAAMHNVQKQLYYGNALLGASFEQLWPVISGGTEALNKYLTAGQNVGVVSEKQARGARMLQEQQRRLELAVMGLGNSIMADLAPSLGSAEGGMAGWIEQNRQWLAADITGTLVSIAGDVKAVSSALGGLKNVSSVFLEWWLAKFAPAFARPFIRADAAIRAVSDYARAHHLPGVSEAEHTARGAEAGAAIGSVVPGVGTGLGAAVGATTGSLWYLDPFGLNDITPGQGVERLRRFFLGGDGSGGLKPPRAIQNNNPLNLKYLPGQMGTVGQTNGFGVYRTPGFGYAAATNQLLMYGQQGNDTIRGIVSRWAPPSGGNPTAQYISDVAAWTGYGPDQHLNLYDPIVMGRLVSAMERQEQGRAANPSDVKTGVDMGYAERGLGAGGMAPPVQLTHATPAPAPVTHTVKGQAGITIRLSGAPPGTSVGATTDGDLFAGPPRIEMPMPAGGGPG